MNPDEKLVKCKNDKCDATIGQLVEIDGMEWLRVNGVIIRSMHGICSKCGAQVHWSTSDLILERIIRRKNG